MPLNFVYANSTLKTEVELGHLQLLLLIIPNNEINEKKNHKDFLFQKSYT